MLSLNHLIYFRWFFVLYRNNYLLLYIMKKNYFLGITFICVTFTLCYLFPITSMATFITMSVMNWLVQKNG